MRKIKHEENKQVYKRMIIMMDHRRSGKVRKGVGKESSETMRNMK